METEGKKTQTNKNLYNSNCKNSQQQIILSLLILSFLPVYQMYCISLESQNHRMATVEKVQRESLKSQTTAREAMLSCAYLLLWVLFWLLLSILL